MVEDMYISLRFDSNLSSQCMAPGPVLSSLQSRSLQRQVMWMGEYTPAGEPPVSSIACSSVIENVIAITWR